MPPKWRSFLSKQGNALDPVIILNDSCVLIFVSNIMNFCTYLVLVKSPVTGASTV